VPMPPVRRTDRLDVPQNTGWEARQGSRFASPSALIVGILALLLGLLVALSAVVVPLLMRGGAQATTPLPLLNPPRSLQALGACDGFFKARTTLTWLPTSSSSADGYVIYRSTSRDGPFFRVDLLPDRTTTSWVDARLNTGTRYYYTIRATGGVRLSDYSVLAETHTPSFCLWADEELFRGQTSLEVSSNTANQLDAPVSKEGVVEGDRFEELKAKAASKGLTDEEAAELGRLYAEKSGEPYHDASSVSGADASAEDKESQERRELDAGAQAKETQERDRSRPLPTGEAPEPDHQEDSAARPTRWGAHPNWHDPKAPVSIPCASWANALAVPDIS
jgi:hypothetical protein